MKNIFKCQDSFEEVSRLREAITEEFSELPLIIIGNKLDLGLWIFQENISTSSRAILLFYFDTFTKENIFSETSFNYKDEFSNFSAQGTNTIPSCFGC